MRFFCCCLPVRLGVFVLSFLQVVFGGAEAGLIWYSIMQTGQVEGTQRVAFTIAGCVFSALALAAFLGLIGSVTRSRSLVVIYATVLYVGIVLTLCSGIFFAYSLYHDTGDNFLNTCRAKAANIEQATQQSLHNENINIEKALDAICSAVLTSMKIAYIVVLVIVFLVELYCAHIVRNYAEQLGEEEASKHKHEHHTISRPQLVPIHHGGYNHNGGKMA